MRISIRNNIIEMVPENDAEVVGLDQLWKTTVDCNKFNRKIVATGEYTPGKNDSAHFLIEGLESGPAAVYAPVDCRVYCHTCNKYFDVKKGEQVPLCCGITMEIMD